jgi:DNA-binding transcriptional LysR family regulator
MVPIRFGYHGAASMAAGIVARAGMAPGTVMLREYAVNDPFRLLRAGGLDVMIGKFAVREDDLSCSATLTVDPRAVVVSTDHPLAGRASVTVAEVAAYDGFRCPGTMPGYVWDQVVPPPIRRRYDLASTAELMTTVRSGRAVHLTVASLAEVAPPGIRLVPVVDLPPAPVFLTWVTAAASERTLDFVAAAEQSLQVAR